MHFACLHRSYCNGVSQLFAQLHIIDDSSAALGGLTPGRTYTIDVFTLSENKNVSSRRSAQLLVTTVETRKICLTFLHQCAFFER